MIKKTMLNYLEDKINYYERALRDLAYIDPYCDKETQKSINKNYEKLERRLQILLTIRKKLL